MSLNDLLHREEVLEKRIDQLKEKLNEVRRLLRLERTPVYASKQRYRKERTGRYSSTRSGVARIIEENPGKTRGEIINILGFKGDTSAEMSLSNALTALIRQKKIKRDYSDGGRGRYYKV